MKKRSTLTTILIFLGFLLLCLALGAFGYFWYLVPQRAEAVFGNPDPDLGRFQRAFLSLRLLQNQNDLTIPLSTGNDSSPFTILSGESSFQVSNHLQEVQLISDARAFRIYLVYK